MFNPQKVIHRLVLSTCRRFGLRIEAICSVWRWFDVNEDIPDCDEVVH
jgi:hypothetical protein